MKRHNQDMDPLDADFMFKEITRKVSNEEFIDRLWLKLIDSYFGDSAHSARETMDSSMHKYRGMDYEEA